MSNPILFGLPNSAGAQQFLTVYMDRSGLLDRFGWSELTQAQVREDFKKMIAKGELLVQPDPKFKVVFVNRSTRLSDSAYRIALEPKLQRHVARVEFANLSPAMVEELQDLNSCEWQVNPVMLSFIKDCEGDAELAALVTKNPQWVQTLVEANGHKKVYTPYFVDRVGRKYGEGSLSITNGKLNRSVFDGQKIPYKVWDDLPLCSLLGVDVDLDPDAVESRLKDWQELVKSGDSDMTQVRANLWLWEMLTTGESGAMGGSDICCSGPLLGGIAARCKSLMHDTNVFGPDNMDPRRVIASRIHIPEALKKWEKFLTSRDAAKPIITALFYGQAARGGAAGMMWDSDDNQPTGWINGFGLVDENICLKGRNHWNPDYRSMIDEMGPASFYRSAKDVSESYNNTFWRSYPEVLQLRQKLEDAYDFFMANQHGPAPCLGPTITAPNGATYTHCKWEVDRNGKSWRFRTPPMDGWPYGLDLPLAPMKNVASGHSLFVRVIHFMDAWFCHEVNREIRRFQKKVFGRVVGFGSVHDYWWVPLWMLPYMHSIVRRVLHRTANLWPKIIDKFLIDNNQEPMRPFTKSEEQKLHASISRNRAFLSLK